MNAPFTKERRRIVSLWFPHLSIERLLRLRLGRSWRSLPLQGRPPLAVSRQENNTQRIAALDEQAARLGLKPGMGIADARAMHPRIEIVAKDTAADRRLLGALADWCDRYTPLVALDGMDGLFLDITGCAHLFGGEEAMLEEMLACFAGQGLCARAGLAGTPGAAWAAARFTQERFSQGRAILREGEERDFLGHLPLAALRVEARTIASLESVGLRTIGAIAAVPRAPLARRFGAMPLLRLDQAFGAVEEAVSPRLPVPSLSVERHFAEPIGERDDIERLVLAFAGSMKRDLERRGEGARRFELLLFRVDGAVTRISAASSLPLREPVPIGRLFHERLAAVGGEVDAGYGFDLVRLSAFDTAALRSSQGDFDGGTHWTGDGRGEGPDEDIALFADRVRARLGSDAILQTKLAESHVPERACLLVPFAGQAAQDAQPHFSPLERPLRLFVRPEPIDVPVTEVPEGPPLNFRWRRSMHRVARAEGPERIAPEWWLNPIPEAKVEKEEEREEAQSLAADAETARLTRDYFRVEDAEGRRYWLFREGLYAAKRPAPRWYLQAISA